MTMAGEMILSGFISKVINEIVDVPLNPIKNAIKNADKNRKDKNQSIETRIYQVTIDSINKYTNDKYKGQEILYDAAESIIIGFKSRNKIEAVRMGLKMIVSQVTSETCENFLKILQHEICIDKDDILYKEITLLQGEQTFEAVHEGFNVSNKNDEKTHEKLDYVIEGINTVNEKVDGMENYKKKHYYMPIKNRANEYAQKWDKNVFLNNFSERDENAGINIKLKDIYLERYLPNYIWKSNKESLNDLKMLLSEYTVDNNDKKMLLILGQPGIGKSTLITWMMANLIEKKENILVYQFAKDLDSIVWQSRNVLKDIFSVIGLEYDELENRTLILDGFDEIDISSDRERILNKLNQELKEWNTLKSFSLIITCRENYIYDLQNIKCDYITLQSWDGTQIDNFCRTYWKKCGNDISEDKIQKISENKEIFGIPLILYMILALDITIEKSSSIVDIYDQIFSLKKGGIYDRCYDVEHRINSPEIKEHIHRISQRIAFWIFKNNADKAFIPQEKFEEICENEMRQSGEMGKEIQRDALIGNFFKLKHCEGKETDELQFVHRSIYEYFVATYFFESIHNLISKEEVAGKLGELLKDGHLTMQMLEFIKCKFDSMKGYDLADITKKIFNEMLRHGMTYYTKAEEPYHNVIERERNIFSNMLEVVRLWNSSLGELDKRIIVYLQCNREEWLNLSGIQLCFKNVDMEEDMEEVDLSGAYLVGADLRKADLVGIYLNRADLSEADLSEANLNGAYLIGAELSEADLCEAYLREAYLVGAYLNGAELNGADLVGANLNGADLRGACLVGAYLNGAILDGACLIGADLSEADLSGTIFSEGQVDMPYMKYDLSKSRVLLSEEDKVISYQEYCIRKQNS